MHQASDLARSLLHDWGWSIAESFYPDPDTGRLVWIVCCLRGSDMIQVRAETETACFVEAVRQAIALGMEREER